MNRQFQVTSAASPLGAIYFYNKETGLFSGVDIKEKMKPESVAFIIFNLKLDVASFLDWCKSRSGLEVVEIDQAVTFEMFWLKYDDRIRSSKKRSQKLWDKLPQAEQVKAHYYITTYNRNRGNAEKKYCETYLNAELWNN